METLTSCWQVPESNLKSKPLKHKDIEADICIIGGGIAGLSIAYELLAAGKKILLLEKDAIATGESINTSAHLSNALDDRYFAIEKMHGGKKAKLAASSHTYAIDRIEEIVKKESIYCEYQRVPGYLFSTDKKILDKESSAALRAGLDVRITRHPDLGKVLLFPEQAVFHPVKYMLGLAKAIRSKGGIIYENTQVTKVDFKKNQIDLADGTTIKAGKIVTATNSQFMSNLKMLAKLKPQRSYVIGISIPKDSCENALYWDNADPYHYVRIEKYDDKHDLLIVGGEDHRVGVTINYDPFDKLNQWAKEKFKISSAKILYKWSGQILEPADYLAYIGYHVKSKRAYMVTGDSGNGLTHGVIASRIICDLINQKSNPWKELYSPKRLAFRAIPAMLNNLSQSGLGYIKHLLLKIAKLPPRGEGKIIQSGLSKIAVFRDEQGKLTRCSGICSHLGAVLTWNPIEKSWDCPAHGSRFNIQGEILNGPATKDLKCFTKE